MSVLQEAWHTLRWLQLHVLLLAVISGREFAGLSAVNGNDNSQNEDNQIDKVKHKPLELMKTRMSELQEFVAKCQEFGEPQQVGSHSCVWCRSVIRVAFCLAV